MLYAPEKDIPIRLVQKASIGNGNLLKVSIRYLYYLIPILNKLNSMLESNTESNKVKGIPIHYLEHIL